MTASLGNYGADELVRTRDCFHMKFLASFSDSDVMFEYLIQRDFQLKMTFNMNMSKFRNSGI
jgi:hypothetical protein